MNLSPPHVSSCRPSILPLAVLLVLGSTTVTGQTRGNLFKIHYQRCFHIESQRATFDVTDLATITVESRMVVMARARTELLTFGIDCTGVHSVRIGGIPADFVLRGDLIGIKLKDPLLPGKKAVVEVRFTLLLPETVKKNPLGQVTFPFSFPIDAVMNFPITAIYRVPPGCVVVTPGVLVKEEHEAGYSRFTWKGTYRPRKFRETLVKGKLFRCSKKGVQFTLACSLADAGKTTAMLEAIEEVYFFLESLYGPGPTGRIAVVQTPAADAMSTRFNLGGIICLQTGDLEDPRDRWLLGCLAHEIAHDWWGSVVLGSEEDNQEVTEAFAEYSSIHFKEKTFGPQSAFDDVITNTAVYLEGDRRSPATSRDRIYSKVFLILRHLMHALGEEDFFLAARTVLKKHAGTQVSHRMVFEAAEKISNKKLHWLLDWLYYTDSDLDISLTEVIQKKKGGGYETRISLRDRVGRFTYPLEVPVEIRTADGKRQKQPCKVGRDGAELLLDTATPVTSIAVDPHCMVWDIDRSNNFFGSHVLSSSALEKGGNLTVDLVGGFRARSGRRARMMSMWLRQENRAHLVPLPDPSCKDGLPLVLETGDGTFLVAMGIAPLRALHVMPSETGKGPPVVLAVVQGSKFASRIEEAWLERRRKVETGKHDRIMAGLKSNDRARRREALEQMMEDESSYREKPLALKSMAAVLEFLKKPVPERARVDAFEILFNINCMHRNDAATVLKNHVDTVLKALGDPNHEVREYAADILWKVPDARVLDALGAALVNDIKHVNMNAIYILELMEDRRAVPYLIEVLKSPSPRARKSAEEALRTITGEEKRNGAEAWLTWWRSRKKR